MVAETRSDLADYLATLTPEQWDTPTLCEGWKVRDAVGHLVEGSNKVSMGRMAGQMLKYRFNIDKMLGAMAIEQGKQAPDVLLQGVRDAVPLQNTPGPTKPEDQLSDWVVHTQDIKRALGPPGTIPQDRLLAALERMKTSGKPMNNDKRIEGLKLVATDIDWSYGDGPEVRGAGEALLLAMCGRTSAIDDLSGDGVATLRTR